MTNRRRCIARALGRSSPPPSPCSVTKDDKNAGNFADLVRAIKGSHSGTRIGIPVKDVTNHPGAEGNLAQQWIQHCTSKAGLAAVDVTKGLSAIMAEKEDKEISFVQKAAVMSNKVMKHGFVKEMESVFEQEGKVVKHSEMAEKLDAILDDPSKIGIKVPEDTIESCYFPIVQSGGCENGFNIKPSALTDDGTMTEDVVICSLGARFKNYCANIARTYVIDSVSKVERTYNVMLKLHAECRAVMQHGTKLVEVYSRAKTFLKQKYPNLLPHLPKSLGFSVGLEFKDTTYTFTEKTDPNLKFKANMVFNLSVGFQDVVLTEAERAKAKGSIKSVGKFSMLLGDTVKILPTGPAEVLTKAASEWDKISYTIKESEDDDDDDDDDDDEDDGDDAEEDQGVEVRTAAGRARVLKSRLRERSAATEDQLASKRKRDEKNAALLEKAREQGLKSKTGGVAKAVEDLGETAKDFSAYSSSEKYPYDAQGNKVHVDMDKEVVFLPIGGMPVPFHISTIKNVMMPDPDSATYLKINFYTPGQALGKDAPSQMAAIVNKAKLSNSEVFVKEFTFRSQSNTGLTQAHRLISELRKRSLQRARQQEQEQDLVVQPKLLKLKDQKVPRLSDIEMRPAISGRKSTGTLDAHQNGLRFTASKTGDRLDIMYTNVKHAFYQPCHGEHIVVIHFHLKDAIVIGKKKTNDVQFITQVVEASEDVSARGNVYDPDEIESEQRERKMRKLLNSKFRDYTVKVAEVASRHNFSLEFDIPYKDLAFQGTPHREMVTLMPSVHCLVNLTETPAFVISMTSVEHVHFERVISSAKNFDMAFIPKDHKVPVRLVSSIDMKDLDDIQEWLSQQDLTYTTGTTSFNWKQIIPMVDNMIEDGYFWDDKDETGEWKAVGWLFLDAEAGDEEEESEEDDDEEEYEQMSEEEESSEDDIDEDDDESFDEEEDDSDEYDEEEEEEAEGQDWEELEEEAKAADKQRDAWDVEEGRKHRGPPSKKAKTRR